MAMCWLFSINGRDGGFLYYFLNIIFLIFMQVWNFLLQKGRQSWKLSVFITHLSGVNSFSDNAIKQPK